MSRRTSILLSASVLLLLAVAAAWRFLAEERGPAGAGTSGRPAAAATPEVEPADLVNETSREARTPTAAAEPAPPAPAEAAPPEPELAPPARPADVLLLGTAVRVEADGSEAVSEDGSFALAWRRSGVLDHGTVEVRGGSWSVEVPPDVILYVHDLALGGVPVTIEPNEFRVPDDRHLVLRGPGRHAVLLHVQSPAGEELADVEVWPGPYAFPVDLRHPGTTPEGEPVVRGDSPLLVPPRADSFGSSAQVFVRAPGHAWGTIALDHAAPGERTLVLQPEGALEVELIGNAAWLDPEVRLWPPDASEWDAYPYAARRPDAEDRAVFEALAPGTYLASVERGFADRRTSYGSATVETVAGKRTVVQIPVELPEKPVPTTVAGTLVLPRAWEHEGVVLELGGEGATEKWLEELHVPLASLQPLEEAPEACDAYAFEVELPTAGGYRLEVLPLSVRRFLRVPAEGLHDLEVVVPPPATAEVTVVDDRTGDEIRVESLFWSSPPIDGILAMPLHPFVADPRTGHCTFRAPAGEVRLATADRSLLPIDEAQTYELAPGRNELELRVLQLIGVRFTFKDGEAEVPWDWSWQLSAQRADGLGDRARSIAILWFLEEGVYELRSAGIPGYRSIDGTPIEVVKGRGVLEVEVPLVRE